MKKYIPLMFALVVFQGSLYCSQVNKAIEQELRSAQLGINMPIPLDLDGIVQVLLSCAQQPGSLKKHLAIFHLEAILKGLENFKAKQYSNYFLSWFVATPDIVKNQIQPAINKVNVALSSLKSNQINVGYAIAGTFVGALALTGGVAATVAIYNKYRSRRQQESPLDAAVKKGVQDAKGAVNDFYTGNKFSVLQALEDNQEAARDQAYQAARTSDTPYQQAYDTALRVFSNAAALAAQAFAETDLPLGEDSDRRSSVGSTNSTATPSVPSDDGISAYPAVEISSQSSASPHQNIAEIVVSGGHPEADSLNSSDGFGEFVGVAPHLPQSSLPVSANYNQAFSALQEAPVHDSASASRGHVGVGVSLPRDEEPRSTIVGIDEARGVFQQSALDPKPLGRKDQLAAKELVGILLNKRSSDADIKAALFSNFGMQDTQAKDIINDVRLARKFDTRANR